MKIPQGHGVGYLFRQTSDVTPVTVLRIYRLGLRRSSDRRFSRRRPASS
jgi:hypothetical protein